MAKKKKVAPKPDNTEGQKRVQGVKKDLVSASHDNTIRNFMPFPLNVSSVLNKEVTKGNRYDKKSFTPAQLKVLYDAAIAAQKRTGRTAGGTEYEDYKAVTDPSTYQHIQDLKNSKVNPVMGMWYGATEPAFDVASTIGRYSYGYDPNTKEVSVSDIYNFTNEHTKRAGENYMKSRTDPYGMIRRGLYQQDKNQTAQQESPYRTNFVISPSDTVSNAYRPMTGLTPSDMVDMGFQEDGGVVGKNWLKQYAQGGKVSTKGYKKNSPDKNEPMLTIPSNRITMQDVGHPVMAYPSTGNPTLMHPGGEYYFPHADHVTEVPIAQQGAKMHWDPNNPAPATIDMVPARGVSASQNDNPNLVKNYSASQKALYDAQIKKNTEELKKKAYKAGRIGLDVLSLTPIPVVQELAIGANAYLGYQDAKEAWEKGNKGEAAFDIIATLPLPGLHSTAKYIMEGGRAGEEIIKLGKYGKEANAALKQTEVLAKEAEQVGEKGYKKVADKLFQTEKTNPYEKYLKAREVRDKTGAVQDLTFQTTGLGDNEGLNTFGKLAELAQEAAKLYHETNVDYPALKMGGKIKAKKNWLQNY
jgi:hypothetical protein